MHTTVMNVIPVFERYRARVKETLRDNAKKTRTPIEDAEEKIRINEECLLVCLFLLTGSEDGFRPFRGVTIHFDISLFFTAKNRNDIDAW